MFWNGNTAIDGLSGSASAGRAARQQICSTYSYRATSRLYPFYCPNDQKVYLDTSFFQDLETRFHGCDTGSKGCQFAQAYVIAHEIGHHVQNLLGILPKVQEAKGGMDKVEANQLQVRVELQADCLAGVWANHAEDKWRFIEPGDIESAMQTAAAIGDDRLQRQTQGYVVPDAFTHGSSQQRARWFMTGAKVGTGGKLRYLPSDTTLRRPPQTQLMRQHSPSLISTVDASQPTLCQQQARRNK
jgi:predicted metalloprotease